MRGLSALLAWLSLFVGCANAEVPRRIVSLNLCTDQILLQLVPRERIAALSWSSQNQESAALHREAQGLRALRGYAEEVLALQPDLVLVGSATTRHTARLLRDYGVTVLALPGAESFVAVYAQIRTVATAVGEIARGEAVIAAMIDRASSMAPLRTAVVGRAVGDIATPYWPGGRSAGAGTLYDDILRAGGYANGGARAGLTGYGALPMERLIAQAPQVVLTNDYKRSTATLGARLLKHPALTGIGAKEVMLPSRLMVCGGPWNLDAADLLAQQGKGT